MVKMKLVTPTPSLCSFSEDFLMMEILTHPQDTGYFMRASTINSDIDLCDNLGCGAIEF